MDSCCSSAVLCFFISKQFKAYQTSTDVFYIFYSKKTIKKYVFTGDACVVTLYAFELYLSLGFSFLNTYVVLKGCL